MSKIDGVSEFLSYVDESWLPIFAPYVEKIHRLEKLCKEGEFLPAAPNVMRAFSIPFESVKVLIVGQDPYPTPGHPIGLSFAVGKDVRPLPRSLVNIYRELADDCGFTPPEHGDLSPWLTEGVMLMNRVLTVTPQHPNSHRGRGWEEITEAAVRALAHRNHPLVAILWGRQAQELRPLCSPYPTIESVHPSPLSASNGFFGSHPFTRANALLVSQGASPVKWNVISSR